MDYCRRQDVAFVNDVEVSTIATSDHGIDLNWTGSSRHSDCRIEQARFDAVVICAGVASRHLAAALGDRVNV
jgi:D-amino-acid dehydrogenase